MTHDHDITRHNLAAESAAWSDEAESGFSANAWAAAHALAENNGWGFGAPRHPDSSPRHPRSSAGHLLIFSPEIPRVGARKPTPLTPKPVANQQICRL